MNKKYFVYYTMKPQYGGHSGRYIVSAPNKTFAGMIAKGELNPCDIKKIEEIKE